MCTPHHRVTISLAFTQERFVGRPRPISARAPECPAAGAAAARSPALLLILGREDPDVVSEYLTHAHDDDAYLHS